MVDFDIATWDFIMDEEDPTSSEGQVGFRASGSWFRVLGGFRVLKGGKREILWLENSS